MDSVARVNEWWIDTEDRLPDGWILEDVVGTPTSQAVKDRSGVWVAVAIGPEGQRHEHRGRDPRAALRALADDLTGAV